MASSVAIKRAYTPESNRITKANRSQIICDVEAELERLQEDEGRALGTYGPTYECVGAKHGVAPDNVRKLFDRYRKGLHGFAVKRPVAVHVQPESRSLGSPTA